MTKSANGGAPTPRSSLLSDLKARLGASGLNLSALLPVSSLEHRWQAILPDIGQLPLVRQSLLLVGNAGPALWASCQQSAFAGGTDQVDRYATDRCRQALQHLPGVVQHQFLYPSIAGEDVPDCGLSLQALGVAAGWHQDSPLGIGINPRHGLWFAYRCLVLLDAEPRGQFVNAGVAQDASLNSDVCLSCTTRDCIKSCPAKALAMGAQPDMQRCFEHRLQPDSECAAQCLARNACPVGAVSRYTAEQTDYHYRLSLASIRRYIEQ